VEWYQRVSTFNDFMFSVYSNMSVEHYNMAPGKLSRGMAVIDTVEILKGRSLTDDEYFKVAVLRWRVELV
jgi:hypothetical protein